MKIESREDAVDMLNHLNDQGHIIAEPRHGMVEYRVNVLVNDISDISQHSFVRSAKQALGILLNKEISGFEGDLGKNNGMGWMAKLTRNEAKELLDAGVKIPDQRLAEMIVSKAGGMARTVAGSQSNNGN